LFFFPDEQNTAAPSCKQTGRANEVAYRTATMRCVSSQVSRLFYFIQLL
jgi:hypothetical protein